MLHTCHYLHTHLGLISAHFSPHPDHQLVHLLGSRPFAIDVRNEAKHSLDGHEGLSHQEQARWVTIQLKVLLGTIQVEICSAQSG